MKCEYTKHWKEYLDLFHKYYWMVNHDGIENVYYDVAPGGCVTFKLKPGWRFNGQGLLLLEELQSKCFKAKMRKKFAEYLGVATSFFILGVIFGAPIFYALCLSTK